MRAVDRLRHVGSLRNSFGVDDEGRRRYWFSINRVLLSNPPLTAGAVYLLPQSSFIRTVGTSGESTEEWSSPVGVTPVARVDVEPGDFPFLDQLAGHDDDLPPRLVDLQPTVLTGLVRIDEVAGRFLLVVPPPLTSEAAEL